MRQKKVVVTRKTQKIYFKTFINSRLDTLENFVNSKVEMKTSPIMQSKEIKEIYEANYRAQGLIEKECQHGSNKGPGIELGGMAVKKYYLKVAE